MGLLGICATLGSPVRSCLCVVKPSDTLRNWAPPGVPGPRALGSVLPGTAHADWPLGGGRIHDPAPLDNDDLAARHQPPSSPSGRLVQLVSRLSGGRRDCARGLVHIDRSGARCTQEPQDRVLESAVSRRHSAPTARGRAIAHLLPIALPLLAPLDPTPARRAGLVWWRHHAILPSHPRRSPACVISGPPSVAPAPPTPTTATSTPQNLCRWSTTPPGSPMPPSRGGPYGAMPKERPALAPTRCRSDPPRRGMAAGVACTKNRTGVRHLVAVGAS